MRFLREKIGDVMGFGGIFDDCVGVLELDFYETLQPLQLLQSKMEGGGGKNVIKNIFQNALLIQKKVVPLQPKRESPLEKLCFVRKSPLEKLLFASKSPLKKLLLFT